MGNAMIYCVGRNYALHVKELGNTVPKSPVIFFKPPASVVQSDEIITLPHFSQNVQFEVELAVKLNASLNIEAVAVANDLTARDKQREAQETKTPWALAKGFKQSCGLGNWAVVQKEYGPELENLELKLTQNGQLKQNGHTKDMIFTVSQVLKHLKENFPLVPGDIILTGTPEGVAQVHAGDEIHAQLLISGTGKVISSGSWKFSV